MGVSVFISAQISCPSCTVCEADVKDLPDSNQLAQQNTTESGGRAGLTNE